MSAATVLDERMHRIYQIHGRAVLRMLLDWTHGDWQAAEGLLQETMARTWRSLDTLNTDPRALRPWLFTVARRIAIDQFRARSARPPETDPDPLEQVVAVDERFDRLLDRDTIRDALRRLTVAHRTALAHVYLLNQTVPEAARALGVPEGTVKSRLYHGLRAARAAIRDDAQAYAEKCA